MTGYLQPLDTHVFAQYKQFLRTEYEGQALATPDGNMRHIDIVKIMMRGIRTVLVERCWSHAFQQNGFSTTQEGVSKSLLKNLGMILRPQLAIRFQLSISGSFCFVERVTFLSMLCCVCASPQHVSQKNMFLRLLCTLSLLLASMHGPTGSEARHGFVWMLKPVPPTHSCTHPLQTRTRIPCSRSHVRG